MRGRGERQATSRSRSGCGYVGSDGQVEVAVERSSDPHPSRPLDLGGTACEPALPPPPPHTHTRTLAGALAHTAARLACSASSLTAHAAAASSLAYEWW